MRSWLWEGLRLRPANGRCDARTGVRDLSKRLSESFSPEEYQGKRVGVVNLHPLEVDADSSRKSFELFLACAAAFENGPAFFVSVVSEDGPTDCETRPSAATWPGQWQSHHSRSPVSTLPRTSACWIYTSVGSRGCGGHCGKEYTQEFPVEAAVDQSLALWDFFGSLPSRRGPIDSGMGAGDVILVSGGAKGITAECLRTLAKRHAMTVVILGRTVISRRGEQLAVSVLRNGKKRKTKIVGAPKAERDHSHPVMVERELAALKGEAEVFRTIADLRTAVLR